jgi:mRNA-degrading endonuclease RelE of RelBE toxin-antitoxin system
MGRMSLMFRLELTQTALQHLAGYRSFEVNAILEAIRTQLPHQALDEARNRKLLRENPLADWELRVQKYRVFYEVNLEQQVVRILAVGHKEHNRLFVGGEEIEL